MKNVDFLPERIRIDRKRKAALIRQGHLLVLCMVGLALLGYLRYGRVDEARGELALLRERSTNLARQIAMRSVLEQQQAELLVKQQIDEHLGSRVSALDILGELQNVMSDRLTLTDMTIEASEVSVPIEQPRGGGRRHPVLASRAAMPTLTVTRRVKLVITGLAPTDIDVANFIGQIAASPLFEDIEMGYSLTTEYNNCRVREFQVTCFVIR